MLRILSLMILVLFSLLTACNSVVDTMMYSSIFQADNCDRPCWLGIQPSISTRSDVEAILLENEINYEVTFLVAEDDTFSWIDNIPELTSGKSDQIIDVSVTFDENNIVMRISFGIINLCVDTVIDWYGEPSIVLNYEDNILFNLIYPELGLNFFINLDASQNIGLVFIQRTDAAINFANQFDEDERATWESVQQTLSTDC